MLKHRARGFAARDCFPDRLRGIKTAEEIIDVTPDEDQAPPPLREVRRISETVAPAVVELENAKARVQSGHDAGLTRDKTKQKKPAAPAAETVLIGPVHVKEISQFLGGYCASLSDGQKVDVTNDLDALELEKMVGSDYKLRLTCEKVENGLSLKSFALAD